MTSGDRLSLSRAAVVRIGTEPNTDIPDISTKMNTVQVQTGRAVTVDGREAGRVVVAAAPLQETFDTQEMIEIPDEARRAAENSIEMLGRILAVEARAAYSLSSPMPFVGFVSPDDGLLDRLVGKRTTQPMTTSLSVRSGDRIELLSDKMLPAIADRSDGIALLAEALSHSNALGRYHEFMRLFERAFRRQAGKLASCLVPFLVNDASPTRMTKQEVHAWIEARPQTAHADHRPAFLLEADVRPWINRMEEAAYDVLLNKTEWRDPSPERRDVWRPVTGSLDPRAGIFMTKGKAATLQFQLLDGFLAYPLILAGPFDDLLPSGVWFEGGADGGVLRKIDHSDKRDGDD